MKYLLFEKSAIEEFASKTGFQSTEFPQGASFINCIRGNEQYEQIETVKLNYDSDKGIIFVGKGCTKEILLFDLTQCSIIKDEKNCDDLLLAFQKVFRTALKIWAMQPFTSSERIHGTKSIVFPFVYTDRRRVVIERAPDCDRIKKRGITHALLAYKYGVGDAPRTEEKPNTSVLKDAGETYISSLPHFNRYFKETTSVVTGLNTSDLLICENGTSRVSDGGFMYLNFKQQLEKMTETQKRVVENKNVSAPIRIEGPAGTGKTASLILRAYNLLERAKLEKQPFSIIFFTHSESTRYEIENAFSILENAELFMSGELPQRIKITTLFSYCIETVKIKPSQVIEYDAYEAKQTQRMLIEDSLDIVCEHKLKTFKPLLSKRLVEVFDADSTPKGTLISMLQHEFSVQIKGRTDGTIEEYYKVPSIKNALPTETKKDKEFVFSIFLEYQNMLKMAAVYDIDDITVQALAQWNAPIWRRERNESGFDYIFVDEMHLFNINEQHAFHYLTKSVEQKNIPICFALDYSQALGDRGNIDGDYIEEAFKNADKTKYKTVFRCSPQITDFCASISAAGALMFQSSYRDPYSTPTSGFTSQEESLCILPQLYMYDNDEEMIQSIKEHVVGFKKDIPLKNSEIAIITFDSNLLLEENVRKLTETTGKKFCVLSSRQIACQLKTEKQEDAIILADPYNINGLEFKCVLLVGVDEGRVPQTAGISDVSENYIKYIAFNQLYLASSRAKYRLVLIGNKLHGTSSCLQYALENETIKPTT